MKVVVTVGRKCLFGLHSWEEVKSWNGIHYYECKHCKSRMAKGEGDAKELDFIFLRFEN